MKVNSVLQDSNEWISKLKSIDWDFAGDQCASSFSTAHWHPCRFVAQIPSALIGVLTKPGDTVLDPFCGSGTALVEAQRLGRIPVGIDINPVATLVTRSKLCAATSLVVARAAERWKRHVLEKARSMTLEAGTSGVPSSVQGEKWYHPETLTTLAFLWKLIKSSRSEYVDVWMAAFSAILLPACNEDRHWGYVCDNTTPKSTRRSDALSMYLRAVDSLVKAYKNRDNLIGDSAIFPLQQARIFTGDTHAMLPVIKKETIDLVVTSPPYFGVCDYVKAQRLTMEWLGAEIEPLRRHEIGARSKRHRKTALEDYLSEMQHTVLELGRVIRRRGHLAMVIGESSHRDSVVSEIENLLHHEPFEVVVRERRQVPVQRRQHPSVKEEIVLIARRTR